MAVEMLIGANCSRWDLRILTNASDSIECTYSVDWEIMHAMKYLQLFDADNQCSSDRQGVIETSRRKL